MFFVLKACWLSIRKPKYITSRVLNSKSVGRNLLRSIMYTTFLILKSVPEKSGNGSDIFSSLEKRATERNIYMCVLRSTRGTRGI